MVSNTSFRHPVFDRVFQLVRKLISGYWMVGMTKNYAQQICYLYCGLEVLDVVWIDWIFSLDHKQVQRIENNAKMMEQEPPLSLCSRGLEFDSGQAHLWYIQVSYHMVTRGRHMDCHVSGGWPMRCRHVAAAPTYLTISMRYMYVVAEVTIQSGSDT
ncbi:hypothetical protein Tco_1353477 [Tanacetum coccineum]